MSEPKARKFDLIVFDWEGTLSDPRLLTRSLFEGVLPMLQDLRSKHCSIAVATGKSRVGLNEALLELELNDVFHATRTADETSGKPDPQMLQELMRELDVTPERTLMVGDSVYDLEMAVHAGCSGVGVSFGSSSSELTNRHREALKRAPSLYLAHSVQDLHQWLVLHV
ncbi:MAG: HAD family hydrolase [Betaproteobacteria bacterium]|nr:HAD family hydrolase [Betaproteobacteria bacterium]NBY71573.1 HAD family hydrolase [Betaproteobacteria bacterium]NDD12297.1 HAD family hydrolase [Betaproteobacteria bacterium]